MFFIDRTKAVIQHVLEKSFKDATSVSFGSKLFTSYILIIFKQRNLLPLIWETAKYSYPCMQKYYRKKMNLMQVSGLQIWLWFFTFRPIASKQLNSLTTIGTINWLGGAVVTHSLWVQEAPGSIPGSCKAFYVWFFVLLLLRFTFWSKNTLFFTKVCNSLYNVNLFSILNILEDLWLIIRV